MERLIEGLPVAALALATYLYIRAWVRVRRAGSAVLRTTHVLAFAIAVLSLALAISGPLDELAASSLSAHMLEHVIIVFSPLLLSMARAGTGLLLGLDPILRGKLARALRRASRLSPWLRRRDVAWALLIATLLVWHIPAFFDATLGSPTLHGLEHIAFFTAGLAYWTTLLGNRASDRAGYGPAMISLFTTMLVGTAAGALLTFSTDPWYPRHAAIASASGIDWLADQRLAGLLMWIPPGVVLIGMFLWVGVAWLTSIDAREVRSGAHT